MSHSIIDPPDLAILQYIVTHVFCPLQLPDGDDHSVLNDRSLAGAITSVARLHDDHVGEADMPQWHCISRMLDNLLATVQFESLDESQTVSQLTNMNVGGKPLSLNDVLRLIACRRPRIPHPSSKHGRRAQEAGRCYHFRVLRSITEGRRCHDYTRKAQMLISWASDRNPQCRVRRQ